MPYQKARHFIDRVRLEIRFNEHRCVIGQVNPKGSIMRLAHGLSVKGFRGISQPIEFRPLLTPGAFVDCDHLF